MAKGQPFMCSFLVRRHRLRPRHKSSPHDSSTDPEPRKILVVDDEPVIRETLLEALTTVGYRVEAVTDGRQALERLRDSAYDILLVDVRMPKLDGEEFYHILTQRAPEVASRILFMTGDTSSEDTHRFLARTGRPFLAKPFDLDELHDAVNSAFTIDSDGGATQ